MTPAKTVTVFGGTGFVGHAVVQALAQRGYLVRVPTREVDKAADLMLSGFVGQIAAVPFALRSDAQAAELLQGSDIVINLIGCLHEADKNTFQTAHVETPARLARVAKTVGVHDFIHLSALGSDMNAASRYARSKAIGEEAVRAFFADAIIFRPSVIFGPRDRFINRFANMAKGLAFLPLIGGGLTKLQPVYVGDVARAILVALDRPETRGRTFAPVGPQQLSWRELMAQIMQALGLKTRFLPLSWSVAGALAWVLEKLPAPPLTRDQLTMMKTDNVLPAAKTSQQGTRQAIGRLEELGIQPTPLDKIMPTYLRTEQ